jgi:hypothetical protein
MFTIANPDINCKVKQNALHSTLNPACLGEAHEAKTGTLNPEPGL